MIFTTSFGYMDPTIRVAKEYPNVHFDHITGYKRSANVATGNIRFYEGRYVQGVVAGLTTKSTKWLLGAFPIPEVIQGINSFARGLRSVNKDATIKVVWVNSWYDPVKESDAAKVLIAEGADVLPSIQTARQCFKLLKKQVLKVLVSHQICINSHQMRNYSHL